MVSEEIETGNLLAILYSQRLQLGQTAKTCPVNYFLAVPKIQIPRLLALSIDAVKAVLSINSMSLPGGILCSSLSFQAQRN